MTDYKGPFGPAHLPNYGLAVCDSDGKVVDVADVADMLNTHARMVAQRCETCRYNDPKQTRSMGMTFDTPWCHRWNMWRPFEVNGCTAHQPKDDQPKE